MFRYSELIPRTNVSVAIQNQIAVFGEAILMKYIVEIPVRRLLAYAWMVAISCVLSRPMAAACHVVTPAGSGSKGGSDWNNALAGLPAQLTRGDSYYLADGSYGSYRLATPASGATLITIKKAIASDNCTNTGWNGPSMGSNQAVFTQITYSGGGYYVINGQVGTFNYNGLPTQGSFGIYVNGTSCHQGSLSRCVGLDMPNANNVTLSCRGPRDGCHFECELKQSGRFGLLRRF